MSAGNQELTNLKPISNEGLTTFSRFCVHDSDMMLADFHVHSTFSDGKLTIAELVDFYGTRGFGCIAITDHICEKKSFLGFAAGALKFSLREETFHEYLRLIAEEGSRAWRTYRMHVIPGFELSKNSWSHHRSAHVLGIGVKSWLSAELPIKTMTRELRAQGALSVAAHPVFTGMLEPQTLHLWENREELADEFDAWEVASGRHFFHQVHGSGLKMVASSDLHHPKQIHSWKTLLKLPKGEVTVAEVLTAVREQRLEFGFWNEARGHIESTGATCQPVMAPLS